MTQTKSRMLPPIAPRRAPTHDCEWQAQTFFRRSAIKLISDESDECVGSGHAPLRTFGPLGFRAIRVMLQNLFYGDGLLQQSGN